MEGGRKTTASRFLLFQAPIVCFCYGKVCSAGDPEKGYVFSYFPSSFFVLFLFVSLFLFLLLFL